MNEYLNAHEVASALGVSVETARKIIKNRMAHIRLGRGEFRVSREELSSFIENEKRAPERKT